MQMDGKITSASKAPEGNLILALAEKYHQSPESVEQWDAYWLNRATTLLRAEWIETKRREAARKK